MRSLVLLVSILLGAALAGCTSEPGVTGGIAPSEDADGPDGSTDGGAPPGGGPGPDPNEGETEYVEGAGGSYACAPPGTEVKVDPNRTFDGGAHQHDYWGGQ